MRATERDPDSRLVRAVVLGGNGMSPGHTGDRDRVCNCRMFHWVIIQRRSDCVSRSGLYRQCELLKGSEQRNVVTCCVTCHLAEGRVCGKQRDLQTRDQSRGDNCIVF